MREREDTKTRYSAPQTQYTSDLKKFIGGIFADGRQHDPNEFLLALMDKVTYKYKNNALHFGRNMFRQKIDKPIMFFSVPNSNN